MALSKERAIVVCRQRGPGRSEGQFFSDPAMPTFLDDSGAKQLLHCKCLSNLYEADSWRRSYLNNEYFLSDVEVEEEWLTGVSL